MVKGNNDIYYADGDIFTDEGFDSLLAGKLSGNDRILILLCDDGSFALRINGSAKEISVGDMLICPPEVELEPIDVRDGCSLKILGIRYAALRQSLLQGRGIWTAMMYARNNPVFHLCDKDLELTKAYYYVIRQKLATARDFYYREIMQSLLNCAFYEICVIINRQIAPGDNDANLSRQELIFKKFIELLSDSGSHSRSVSDYADKLCITPKYLSAAVRNVSGKTAYDLILQSAVDTIRHDLLYSDKSIKEISQEYDFPSLSCFGKFIRARLGMSPRELRRRASERSASASESVSERPSA